MFMKYIPPWSDLKFALLAFVFIIIGGYMLESRRSFYRLEYAKSSYNVLSKCQYCLKSINGNTLKLGMLCDEMIYGKWHHIKCINNEMFRQICISCDNNVTNIDGFRQLAKSDQIQIKKMFDAKKKLAK